MAIHASYTITVNADQVIILSSIMPSQRNHFECGMCETCFRDGHCAVVLETDGPVH